MSQTTSPDAAMPLACVPGAIPAAERAAHFQLVRHLFSAEVRERRVIDGGYAFRFDAAAFDDIARWITNERRCCPFLTFGVEVSRAGGPVWVRLTGPEGTRVFLDAEFSSPQALGHSQPNTPAISKA